MTTLTLNPTPIEETQIVSKLLEGAGLNAELARDARQRGAKDEAKFFQCLANANARALEQWNEGIRPQALDNGGWMLPSKSDGSPHILTKDADWRCTCAAGDSDHWAKMLIVAVEATINPEAYEQPADAFADANAELAALMIEQEGFAPAGWQDLVAGDMLLREQPAPFILDLTPTTPSLAQRLAEKRRVYAAIEDLYPA